MPIVATILVSPHPLQPGWWDGHGDVAIDSVPGGTETRPIPYDYERGIYIASVIGATKSFIIQLSAENT